MGSAVPWNAMIGIGAAGVQSSKFVMPATGAIAAKRSAIRHANNDDIIAPIDRPLT